MFLTIRNQTKYDTYSKLWITLADFPARHDITLGISGAAACINKKIILCGTVPRIDMFDIESNEWEESSLKMPLKLSNIFMMTV